MDTLSHHCRHASQWCIIVHPAPLRRKSPLCHQRTHNTHETASWASPSRIRRIPHVSVIAPFLLVHSWRDAQEFVLPSKLSLSLSPPIILCTCCTSSSHWLEEALKPPLLLLPLSHLLLFIACRPLFFSPPGHRLITQCVLSLLVFSPLLSSPSKHYLLAPLFSFFPVCFFVDPEFLKTKQEHKQLHRFKNHCFLFQGFLLNLKTRHHSVSI